MTHFFHHICRLSAPIHPNPLVMIQIPCHKRKMAALDDGYRSTLLESGIKMR
ncbi:MAG: hypothetical protein ACRC24_07195 [Vibrionaceae bacterium]